MSHPHDDVERLHRSAEAENLYLSVHTVVGGTLMRTYGMSEAAVDAVLQDVYRMYQLERGEIKDPFGWLVRHACSEAARHLKLRGIEGPRDPQDDAPRLRDILLTQAALDTLPARLRQVIRMHYDEGKTSEQIAEELEVTVPYARKLLSKGMALLRKWLAEQAPPEEPPR